MSGPPRPLLIAHGYGNRRHRIEDAVQAGADMVEADLRYRAGDVWVRHEHRLALVPVLYNWRLAATHRAGPWALSLGPLFLRLDVDRLRLAELVERVSGRCGLLLDLKGDRYSDSEARALVERALAAVDGFAGTLAFCGSWRLLDIARAMRPQAWLHYSVDSAEQWRAIQPRLGGEAAVKGITIRLSLLSEDRAAALREAGIRFFCWDVHSLPEAERAAALGAAGIIAGEIEILRALAESRRVEH